jgi:hypothetical protein
MAAGEPDENRVASLDLTPQSEDLFVVGKRNERDIVGGPQEVTIL